MVDHVKHDYHLQELSAFRKAMDQDSRNFSIGLVQTRSTWSRFRLEKTIRLEAPDDRYRPNDKLDKDLVSLDVCRRPGHPPPTSRECPYAQYAPHPPQQSSPLLCWARLFLVIFSTFIAQIIPQRSCHKHDKEIRRLSVRLGTSLSVIEGCQCRASHCPRPDRTVVVTAPSLKVLRDSFIRVYTQF